MSRNTLSRKTRDAWTRLQADVPSLGPYALLAVHHHNGVFRMLLGVPLAHRGEFPRVELARLYRRPLDDVQVGEGPAGAHTLLVSIVVDRRPTALDKMAPPPESRRHSVEDGTAIGRLADGQPCVVQWVGGHTMCIGTTGSGKSTVLRQIVADLSWCEDADTTVIEVAKQGIDYAGIGGAVRVVTGIDEARAWLRDFPARAKARRPADPHLIVVLDEYLFVRPLAGDTDGKADKAWVEMASLLRSYGVSLVVGAQRGTADYLPSSLRAMCQQKIVLATESDEELRYAAGGSGPAFRSSTFRLGEMAVRRLDNRTWTMARAWAMPPQPGTRHACNFPFPAPPWGATTPAPAKPAGAAPPAPIAPAQPLTAPPDPGQRQPHFDPTLDDTDVEILDAVNGHKLSQAEIARRLGVDPSTICRRIDRLARHGHLVKPARPRRAPITRSYQ